MCLTDFFARVCVLNLPYKPERRARLGEQLAKLGLCDPEKVRWVRAVSGDACPAPAYFRGGNGAWGCLQSHARVVQDATMDNAASCLILEDDAIFHPDAPRLLAIFLSALPSDWDQVYLGGQHLKDPEELTPGAAVWRVGNVNRTHAYALSRGAYARFLQHICHAPDYIERGPWHLDHQLGLAHERKTWNAYCPAWWIAGQAAGDSNISGRANAEMWWQPASYAKHLPFLFVPPEGLTAAQNAQLQQHVHFGWSLKSGTFIDTGLDQVASGYKGLGEWLAMIAREALDRCLLPGICHPGISFEAVQAQWPNAQLFHDGLDLAALGNYPANGLFEHPLWP